MKSKLLKGGLTVLGAVCVSTLGIFASDGLSGIDRSLIGLTSMGTESICSTGMVPVRTSIGTLCVDQFEASVAEGCPHLNPQNIIESEDNASQSDCFAASKKGNQPWRYISLPQAQRMCAAAGKRLPTSDEWYTIALGTDETMCNTSGSKANDSGTSECVSTIGAYDTIGNVWEWVDETVIDRSYAGRVLPPEGYVASVDASGVAITTDPDSETIYGKDYFWSKETGVFGMLRGGFYGSKSDAGLYAVNASVQTSFASPGVGFRCVKDIF